MLVSSATSNRWKYVQEVRRPARPLTPRHCYAQRCATMRCAAALLRCCAAAPLRRRAARGRAGHQGDGRLIRGVPRAQDQNQG